MLIKIEYEPSSDLEFLDSTVISQMSFHVYSFLWLPISVIYATCAMRIFSAFNNTDTNISLENACKMLKIEHPNAHRAKSDVLVTMLRKIAGCEA